jgi:hypothetical protein
MRIESHAYHVIEGKYGDRRWDHMIQINGTVSDAATMEKLSRLLYDTAAKFIAANTKAKVTK